MKHDQPRLEDYLAHIDQAIERIKFYTAGMTEADFLEDLKGQDAVIRNLEIVGEASRKIETLHPAFAAEHPSLPLRQAYRMRNFLAHGYFAVNLPVVWQTIHEQLPGLQEQVQNVAAKLKQQP